MNLTTKSDDEIGRIATLIMDNLMEGATEMDWEKHTRDFIEGVKQQLTRSGLQRQCRESVHRFGNYAERELLGITRRPNDVNVLWKQRMSKSAGE